MEMMYAHDLRAAIAPPVAKPRFCGGCRAG
jgi:hypothetical protein